MDGTEEVAPVNVLAGAPLVANRASPGLAPASASAKASSFVVGLAQTDTGAGFVATALQGAFALSDWTSITGSASLVPGSPYFLTASGGLSITPPNISGQCIVVVGEAVDTVTLRVSPQPPILL